MAKPDKNARFPVAADDGIVWRFPDAPQRIVAVGDIHGDLRATADILLERAVINDAGHWCAGPAHLVLMGDLVGGHEDSRLLLEMIMRLEKEAAVVGGRVHALLGNHDLLPVQKKLRGMTSAERRAYEKPTVAGTAGGGAVDAFAGDSVYARWIRTRNSLVQIGETLFVHAGIDEWALEVDAGAINSTVRAWIRFWQGVGEKPAKETRWTVGSKLSDGGPLWLRAFKVRAARSEKRPKNGPSKKTLEAVLEHFGARRVVVGHAPVHTGEILIVHPYYDDCIVMIDTRLSDEKNGRLSALELSARGVSSHYAIRTKWAAEIVAQERRALETGPPSLLPKVAGLVESLAETTEKLLESIKSLFR